MITNITAAIIIIGNEILSGSTVDINTSFLASNLNKLGIKVIQVRTIPDIIEEIIYHVNEIRQKCDYVFTTGGIGPTHDDVTAISIARAFDVELILNEDAVSSLREIYIDHELTAPRLKMAYIPEGATLIPNLVSKAPGFIMENVYVMAGIPNIMQSMFNAIIDGLKHGQEILSHNIVVFVGESKIAEKLTQIQDQYKDIEIGSYPFKNNGTWATNIVFRGIDEKRLMQLRQDLITAFNNFITKNI